MANIKITALPAYADPASTDVLPIVDVGADVTKKVSIENLLKNASSGTAGAPGIAFDGDNTGTGIYHPGSGQVAISTNGTGRLFVDSSGNVGIGQSSPSRTLDVLGGFDTARIQRSGGANDVNLELVSGAGTNYKFTANDAGELKIVKNGAERMRLDSSGRLGLGTSSPQALFQVFSPPPFGASVKISDNTQGTGSLILGDGLSTAANVGVWRAARNSYSSGGNYLNLGGYDGVSISTGAASLGSQTAAITIDNSQRVGVGTTSPSYQLTVEGSTPYLQLKNTGTNTGSSRLIFGDADTASPGQLIYDHTDNSLQSVVNGSERVRIDSSGRLLVGTSTSSGLGATLQVIGDTAAQFHRGVNNASGASIAISKSRNASYGSYSIVQDDDLIGTVTFRADDGTDYNSTAAFIGCYVDGTPGADDMPGRLVFSTTADGASSPTERMRIRQDGNVYINTTSDPSVDQARLGVVTTSTAFPALSVVGGVGPWAIKVGTADTGSTRYLVGICNNSGTTLGGITTNGTLITYGGTSDYRLKENVAPVVNALDTLEKLKPVTFTWKSTGEVGNGFIAHELAEVFPDAVAGEKDALESDGSIKPQMVDQSKLVSVLTAALQEAIGEIESLKARVAALESA